jgi:hypothetical protein
MFSARLAKEPEDFGKSWLGLGIGGGGGDLKRSHGDRRSSALQFDLMLFPQSVKEEDAAEKQGARKRLKIADDDGSHRSHEPSPSDDGGDGAAARKKLRLTKEQSTLLEETFRAHNILSHVRMHVL